MEQFDISEDTPTLLDDQPEESRDGGTSQDKAGEGPQARFIGYRWLASRGNQACPKCAALHNKVFYKNPQPGQASIDDMPKGQLHPNCGCTTEPVIEHIFPERSKKFFKPTIQSYMKGKIERGLLGVLVRVENLKSKGCTPIHGKFCGDFWTGGRDTSHDTEPDLYAYDSAGDDDLDEVCKEHDLGYDVHGRDSIEVDENLVEGLKALDPDPRNWSNPPKTEEDIEYARSYRNFAIGWFYDKARAAKILKLLKQRSPGNGPDIL